MLPALTVGVTTHNESNHITTLLDLLALLDGDRFQIIVYDDASTDGTASIISSHPLAKKPNVIIQLAEVNFGSPSIGRQYIADHAGSQYVTFVDGDDLINPEALMALAQRLRPGFDMIVTPYLMRGRRIFSSVADKNNVISSESIAKILSGIGGKIYNRKALISNVKDEIKGRSEDVRLNMRILLAGLDRICFEDCEPFYVIESSRKSTFARNILLPEVAKRVENFQIIKARYGLDDSYIKGLHRNLLKVVREDPTLSDDERSELYSAIRDVMPFKLKTIIHLVNDFSAIGGVPGRIRRTVDAARKRDLQHVCIAAQSGQLSLPANVLCAADDPNKVVEFLGSCHITDTVVITPNNIIRSFPDLIQRQLRQFPILHMASGQLAFIVQDSPVLADLKYSETYKASKILCLSRMDMEFHRQLGIYDLAKVKLPVETRSENLYRVESNRYPTYVGRIDFHTKGADRLVPIAKLMKMRGLPPLQIFTTDGRNSPDLGIFTVMLEDEGVADWVKIVHNETDKSILYGSASVLLLPSRKESFGNVILEAFSFGVPVIAPSYAPGPAEIIRHGVDGFLLDDFSDHAVTHLIEKLSADDLILLSRNCFSRHFDFSMDEYLSSLEETAMQVSRDFTGANEVRVFPRLRALEVQRAEYARRQQMTDELLAAQKALDLARTRLRLLEESRSWRVTAPLRRLLGSLSSKSRTRRKISPSVK